MAKHIKAEKLQARLHFLFGFCKTRNFPERNWKGWRCTGPDTFVTKEREAAGIGQAQGKQGLSKEKLHQCLTSLQLPGAVPLQPAHAALCCSSPGINGQNTKIIGSILLPTQITHEKAGTELHFWEHSGFLSSSASFVVSVSQIFHLSLEKQQVPEKALSQVKPKKAFQTNKMSSYTNPSLSHLY